MCQSGPQLRNGLLSLTFFAEQGGVRASERRESLGCCLHNGALSAPSLLGYRLRRSGSAQLRVMLEASSKGAHGLARWGDSMGLAVVACAG